MLKRRFILKGIFYCVVVIAISCKKPSQAIEDHNGINEGNQDTVATMWPYSSPFPFDMPPVQTLRSSSKKVFAHYFTQFPISEDNKDPQSDYYQLQYLNPLGEGGVHAAYGGYLRIRPIPRAPVPGSDWMEQDMMEEVRRAIAVGIDGFALDILSYNAFHATRMLALLNAAHEVDTAFKIMLMPDMDALKNKLDQLDSVIVNLASYPACYRFSGGQLVVSPYNAQKQTSQWWNDWLSRMKDSGVDVALVPVFQGWKSYASDFAPFSYALSDWGWSGADAQRKLIWKDAASSAHAYNAKWMMPVRPQDVRPRNFRYWESENSEEYRLSWKNAIEGGADWVQLITWNDYAENTVIAPSSGTQYAFYDLTAYYTTWFKSGNAPLVQRDVLYYFYRNQSGNAQPDLSKQAKPFELDQASGSVHNEIELLGFLEDAGTLEIEINGHSYSKEVSAGITSFKIPSEAGRPVFRLYRNDSAVVILPGAFDIRDSATYQNQVYYGGSNSRPLVAEN